MCFFCLRGQINLCDQREVIGVSAPEFRRMGAFAEFVTAPERIAYHLPTTMPFEHAALIEAVSVAVHAVSLTTIAPGDRMVVIVAGMIGLLTLQAARHAGASEVTVFDIYVHTPRDGVHARRNSDHQFAKYKLHSRDAGEH